MVPTFFDDKPIAVLLGAGVSAAQLNDMVFGWALNAPSMLMGVRSCVPAAIPHLEKQHLLTNFLFNIHGSAENIA